MWMLQDMSDQITYWIMGYGEREHQMEQCINRVRPYVDRVVIVHDGSMSKKFQTWATDEMECELFYRYWNDNFSANRNYATKQVKSGWMLWSDPDELFCEEFLKDLPKIIKESQNGKKSNAYHINSHDIELNPDGTKKYENKSDWYKMLFVKFYPGIKWTGSPHEQLHGPWSSLEAGKLPDKYYYEHTKTHKEVCERAARNFSIGGGGNNEKTSKWRELVEILKRHGLHEELWPKMRVYYRAGNIHGDIKDWLIRHRNDNDKPNVDCEVRDFFTWYFVYLHPEENTGGWKSEPKQKDKERETDNTIMEAKRTMSYLTSVFDLSDKVDKIYLGVLGRHADAGGRANYVLHLLCNTLTLDDIAQVLKESEEYKSKYGDIME